MSYFAVRYTYTDDRAAQDELRPRHRAFLGSLADEGLVIASGPLLESVPGAAMLLMKADSAQAVRDRLADDPFQRAGHVAQTTIEGWNPVIGIFAEDRD